VIQPLRRNHFWIWVLLSTFLGVLFAVGLLVRRPTTPKNPHMQWEQFK